MLSRTNLSTSFVFMTCTGQPRPAESSSYISLGRFTPDGKRILLGIVDDRNRNAVVCYDVATGQKLWEATPVFLYGISPDSRTMFATTYLKI